jgi:WhiB family redox-sensing transcriptional regulator
VIAECAADALDNREEFGVWGGMTERQRRVLLKRHPEVVSWAEFFAAQRKQLKRV